MTKTSFARMPLRGSVSEKQAWLSEALAKRAGLPENEQQIIDAEIRICQQVLGDDPYKQPPPKHHQSAGLAAQRR